MYSGSGVGGGGGVGGGVGDFGGGGVRVRGGLGGVNYPRVNTMQYRVERDLRNCRFWGRGRSNELLQLERNNLPLCGEKYII